MILKTNYKKILIILAIFIGLFFLLSYFSHNTASEKNNQQTDNNDAGIFKSVSVEPNKIKVGETQTTRVEIKSVEGVEKVSAQIPFEGNYDEIALKLVEGDKYDGAWEGKWVAHNTLTKEYETKIIAITSDGKIETTTATWWDDTETTWLEGWSERRKITVTENSGSELTDYQVPVDLTTGIYDNTGLVGSWHFSEGSGTFAADSSGNGNNCTINNATWTTNKEGEATSALDFSPSYSYLTCGSDTSTELSSVTMTAWIKGCSAGSTYAKIISKRSSGAFYFMGCSNQYPYMGIGAGGTSYETLVADNIINDDSWHFVAATFDNDTNLATVYVDSISKSTTLTYDIGSLSGIPLLIGRDETTNYFTDPIDEVRLYNRALSESEIKQLYGEGKTRLDLNDLRFTSADGVTELSYWLENDSKAWVKIPTLSSSADTNIYYYFGNPTASAASSASGTFIREISSLVAAWNFDEGSGSVVYDSSGNNKTGTLTNGPTWVADRFGNLNSAVRFDGDNDYMITPFIDLTGTNKVTFVTSFKATTVTSGDARMIAEFSPNFNDYSDAFSLDYDEFSKSVHAVLYGDSYSFYSNRISATQLTADTWYHIAAVFDKSLSSDEAILYMDGTSEGTNTFNADNYNNFGNRQLYFAARGGAQYFADITLDEVQLYDTVLTSAEISDISNNATYSVSSYPGKTLVYKRVASSPTCSISSQEEKRPTDAGASGVSGSGPLAF